MKKGFSLVVHITGFWSKSKSMYFGAHSSDPAKLGGYQHGQAA